MTVTTTDQATQTIATASTQTQGNTTSTQADTPTKQYLKLAGLIFGLSTVLLLMLLAFVTPLLNSGAKDLPLAVGGPEAVTTQITQGLQAKSPDAFDVSTYNTAEEATQAVKDRDAIGAITAGPEGVTIVTANGAGSPYVQLLKQMGAGMAESGQHVNYVDVAPMTAKDPTGSALTALAMPMIFGGMSTAAIFSMLFKNSRTKQLIGALGVAILGGLVASSVLYFGFDALAANFWPTTAVIILGIAAIATTVLGLNSLLGFAGLGLGAVTMLFISNPLSGMATGMHWLPSPWGAIGQYLPLGAAGTAIRSSAFFDGAGMTNSVIVLLCWIIAGITLAAAGAWRARRTG